MVFGISQTAASDYALIARSILADAPDHDPGGSE
jgi:hypothetical protein